MLGRLLPLVLWVLLHGTASAQPLSLSHRPEHQAVVRDWIGGQLPELLTLYRHLHSHPELSLRETETAARMGAELKAAGYAVHTGVGGHGVVALLDNGTGPTLLLRGDMDGLPVVESTGLPYASTQTAQQNGRSVGVMHACGHDVHMTNLIGSARFLAAHRQLWQGRLMIIAQPAEELGQGSLEMLRDGLFLRFGRPNYAVALHVDPDMPAGSVGAVPGWAAANVDSVDITVFGRSGHGARPHQANDPVLTAAHLVTALQTLVSRRVDPQAPAVVTVGSIHGGSKHNVIPDQVTLQLTVRSYSDSVREQLLSGIRQLARDTCASFGCPKQPRVQIKKDYTPAVYNHPQLAEEALGLFGTVLGEGAIHPRSPTMGGEDFGRYPRALKIPGLLFRLGSVEPKRYRRSLKPGGAPLPSLHSSAYAPEPEATLRTGLAAMIHLAIALLPAP